MCLRFHIKHAQNYRSTDFANFETNYHIGIVEIESGIKKLALPMNAISGFEECTI